MHTHQEDTMTAITALTLNTQGELDTISITMDGDAGLTGLQKAVGGYVEVIDLTTDRHGPIDIWLDEEGTYKYNTPNLQAMLTVEHLRRHSSFLPQPLFGPAVFTSHDNNGNLVSLTEEQITTIRQQVTTATPTN